METIVAYHQDSKIKCKELLEELSKKFKTIPRKNYSIKKLMTKYRTNILVVEKNCKLVLHTVGGNKLFFHPGLFKIRLLNYIRTKTDPMITAMDLKEGDFVLDCNLGLAQDALLSAFVSKREVLGIEKDTAIYEIVKNGLKSYQVKGKLKVAEFAFKLIKPVNADNRKVLKSLKSKSFDVVYFSPMFIKPKWECSVMKPLREVAPKDFPDEETIEEASRVARKRVVIKINKGAKELFPYLSDFKVISPSGRVEYLYREV